MRDHGCYMYSATKVIDDVSGKERIYEIEDIRRWMGDFTASKNVPKLMSRMGQCFTQAQVSFQIIIELCLVFEGEGRGISRKYALTRVNGCSRLLFNALYCCVDFSLETIIKK